MLRSLIFLLLLSAPIFATEKMVALSCGCIERDFAYDGEPDRRTLPGALNGIVTSMKCCPGLWAVSAAALAVGGVAYALADSPTFNTAHAHR